MWTTTSDSGRRAQKRPGVKPGPSFLLGSIGGLRPDRYGVITVVLVAVPPFEVVMVTRAVNDTTPRAYWCVI